MDRSWIVLIVAPGVLAGCATDAAEVTYIERLGNDTLAVEAFVRTADRIEGHVLTRRPATRVGHYVAVLGTDEAITRLSVDWMTPPANPGGAAPQHLEIQMMGDSATIIRGDESQADTTRIGIPERTIPVLGKTPLSVALWEQVVRQALASGETEWSFNLLPAGRPRVASNAITRRSADTVAIGFFGNPLLAHVDEEGRILGVTGRETTLKVETERVGAVDLDRLAADFAARDARGEGFGTPSPADSVVATASGVKSRIDYSRPARRGRDLWGSLIPFNEVWRTGANAATMFSTDRDLLIGGARVPAGAYTLWTTFTTTTDTLIINSQTGQWGTAYDVARDFTRVPLERGSLSAPVERFTMEIEPRGAESVLRLMWGRRVLSVGMRMPN